MPMIILPGGRFVNSPSTRYLPPPRPSYRAEPTPRFLDGQTVSYDDDLRPGDSLVVVQPAHGFFAIGEIVHFERYGNDSTIHLREVPPGRIGKVGFDPGRFVHHVARS